MSAEAVEHKETTERWNLSDDDDYVDINVIEDEEPENHLKEKVDELIAKIKTLLKGDSFTLELKEVPRYISAKQIEQFFEIDDPSRGEVEDPDPKNKRDVLVTFFNTDDFCNALKMNGKLIGSYTYVATYNPSIHRSKKSKPTMKRKESDRFDKKRGPRRDDNYRREQSGDVRKQDKAHEFRDNHDKRDSGRHRDYYRKGDHKDNSGRHENKGAYSQVGRRYPSSFHRKQETATVMETTNRFGGFNDDDEEE